MNDAQKPCRWTVENHRYPLGETGDYENVESLLCDGEVVASRADSDDERFEEIAEAMNTRPPSPKLELPQEVQYQMEVVAKIEEQKARGIWPSKVDSLTAMVLAAFIRRIAGEGDLG
jgi:hypothetical protein